MKVQRTCECCKRPFAAKSADVARGWARFCSKRCKAIRQTQERGVSYSVDDEADQSWGEHEVWMDNL